MRTVEIFLVARANNILIYKVDVKVITSIKDFRTKIDFRRFSRKCNLFTSGKKCHIFRMAYAQRVCRDRVNGIALYSVKLVHSKHLLEFPDK